MNLLLLAAGLGVIAGGSLAVGAAGATGALGGLLAILILAPFIADPLPSPLLLAIRGVAALLTVELLWVVLHRAPDLRRASPLGLPALLVAGAAAALVGLTLPGHPAAPGEAVGPAGPVALDRAFTAIDATGVALGAAIALGVIALPGVLGRSGLGAVAIGGIVLISAAELLRLSLVGPVSTLEQVGLAVLPAALAAATVAVASAIPAGPPLAGRGDADADAGDGRGRRAGLIPRTRIPIWPGLRSVTPALRRRDRTPR